MERIFCCFCRSETKGSLTKHEKSSVQLSGFDDSRQNTTEILMNESQQERQQNTADVPSNAVIQDQHGHDQTSDTEDKAPLVDNDSMGKKIAPHTVMGQTSESASHGICSEGRRNLSDEDRSQVLSHTESPITFPDKGDTEDKAPLVDNDSMGKKTASHTVMKNPFQGQTSESASDGICSEGRRNLSDEDRSQVLSHTGSPITSPDNGKETWEAQTSKLKEELDLLTKKRNHEKQSYEEDLQRKREQIKQLEEDNNELLNRLSSQAAARMTYNNPYITDLSDQNRPAKISERYSELYDNQWTDAFELLQTNHHLSETKAIEVLLKVLSVSFEKCKKAREPREGAVKALKRYIGEEENCDDVTILEVMRTLKGTKRNIKKMQEEFNQQVRSELATENWLPDIRLYMNECVEICLLMNIQEPPVEFRGLEPLSGSAFDLSAFQSYTKSGNKIEYIVWPAMYLYQNGPLLRKGVAQGMQSSSNVLRPTDTEDDANKDEFTADVVGKQRDPEKESTIDQVPKDKNADNEHTQHKEKRKESLFSVDPHGEISSHPSQNKTETRITQDGQSDGSPHMNHTETKLAEKVEKKARNLNITDIQVTHL